MSKTADQIVQKVTSDMDALGRVRGTDEWLCELTHRSLTAIAEQAGPVGEVDGFGMVWWKDRPPQGTKLFLHPAPDHTALLRQARDALKQYTNVCSSVNDPNDFTPKVKDEGHYAREALAAIDAALPKEEWK